MSTLDVFLAQTMTSGTTEEIADELLEKDSIEEIERTLDNEEKKD